MWEGLGFLSRPHEVLRFKIEKQNTAAASVLRAPASLLSRLPGGPAPAPSALTAPSPWLHGHPAGAARLLTVPAVL